MRRRRHKLEVSTFPFLAVLLCTMGSLILLLLVIDRRAKAAARERALVALQKRRDADSQANKARRDEWERKRQDLHALLARQEQELVAHIGQVEKQRAEAAGRLE